MLSERGCDISMARLALVISKEELDALDSRFAWTTSLSDASFDFSDIPVVILHNSTDDKYKLLEGLSKLRAAGTAKKFIYINNQIDPLLYAFIDGLGGVSFNDDCPLSDPDLLIDLINEYRENEFRLKSASDEFNSLRDALKSITSGEIDEEELHALVTSPNWLNQIQACLSGVSSSLTVVDTSHKALVEYTGHNRDLLLDFKGQLAKMKSSLEDAVKAKAQEQESEDASSMGRNSINFYPTMNLLPGINNVLLIKELSPCQYLTSFVLAYSAYLSRRLGISNRVLLTQHASKIGLSRYPADTFYSLTSLSLSTQPPAGTTAFITTSPTTNVINFFFGDPNVKVYIIIDRMYQDNMMFRSSPKIKNLFATGNLSLVEQRGLSQSNVIMSNLDPKFDFKGINIPSIAGFRSVSDFVGLYYKTCKTSFQKLDELLKLGSL